jgi:hypothetical protein
MLEKRDKIVRWCFYSKSSAAVLLIAGVIFIGVATVSKMWSPPPAPVTQAPPTHPQ